MRMVDDDCFWHDSDEKPRPHIGRYQGVNRKWRAEIGANDPQTDMGVVQIRALTPARRDGLLSSYMLRFYPRYIVGKASYDVARTIRLV